MLGGAGLDGDIRLRADATESWPAIPAMFRASTELPSPWEDMFGPLRTGKIDALVVVGQIGQSLDGRIATTTGQSHYINGPAGLAHLHRLRALVDAVVVGVGTALADDPQLTVRRVAGPDPARVVIDPSGRLAPTRATVRRGRRRAASSSSAQGAHCRVPRRRDARSARGRRAYRASGDHRRPRRNRIAPRAGRGRPRHALAFPCGGLSRPPARGRRADHSRRRPRQASRSTRSTASIRRCVRRRASIRSTAKCCSIAIFPLNGCWSDARRSRRDRRASTSGRKPDDCADARAIVDFRGGQIAEFVRRRGPAGQQIALNVDVSPTENPIRRALDHRVAQSFEARDRRLGRRRTQRRPESLVAALVPVDGPDHLGIEGVSGFERDSPVVGERRVEQ